MDFEDGSAKGRHILAESLKAAGIDTVFGIVGYPVIELGMVIQQAGIKYIGFRNEQSASYAAAAYGYLTGKPAVCLVVPGPGVIHALAGLANAASNGWPVICIAGSSELEQEGLGAFQEALAPQGGAQLQIEYTRAVCKYSVKVVQAERIPYFVEQAVRYAKHGRPGPCYIEVAGDTLREKVDIAKIDITKIPMMISQSEVRMTYAPEQDIVKAMKLLQSAKRPLVIVGKGAAYCDASALCRKFVDTTGIPFLPSPMGKGVIPDDHDLCSSSARSYVLKSADVILLVGARLNWILHYGLPPRYAKDVKFIHIEILPEEIDSGRKAEIGLCGHAKAIMEQMVGKLGSIPIKVDKRSEWMKKIQDEKDKSVAVFKELIEDRCEPMNYYCALSIVDKYIPKDALIVNEGSDTMDIGRTVLLNYEPKSRLDAGSWGTMGVGMGQAIAAALYRPNPGCVFVCGDSAFGFSAMEFEVVTRYKLPVIVVIINNNGIGPFNPDDYMGTETTEQRMKDYPGKSLAPETKYEVMGQAFGAKGIFVKTADGLEKAIKEATATRPFKPTVINCMISVTASRGKPAAPPFAKTGKL